MKNMAYSGDVDYRASHVPIDESFMIDVSGQMKKGAETKKPEQVFTFSFVKYINKIIPKDLLSKVRHDTASKYFQQNL